MNSVNLYSNISYSAKNQPKNDASHHQKKLGTVIGVTTVGVGLTVLGLSKGFSKTGRGKINKLYTYLTQKSEELAKKKVFTKSEKFTKDVVNAGKSVAESSRSVMNVISFKDILFKKITNNVPFLGNACQSITNFFEKIAVKTTANSYDKTTKQFNKMYSAFEQANTKLDSETVKAANNTIDIVKRLYNKDFSVGNTLNRINQTKQGFQTLDEKIWNVSFKNFKNMATNKNTYSSFIAEQLMAGEKSALISNVNNKKAAIHFSFKDDYANLRNIAEDIKGMIDPFNKKTTPILDNIKNNLELFNKRKSPLAKQTILEDLKTLTKYIDNKEIAEQFAKSIDEIPTTRQGRLQTLLSLYKNNLSENDYKKLEKQVNKAINSLDQSTYLETNKLFDKMRDLKIGSAPTDMLTLLATFATVGIGLGKAENDDERASAALKYGIPAIGTVLTTMYGTLKMFTAAKSLVFGAISGLVINKLGQAADNLRLQNKNQQA